MGSAAFTAPKSHAVSESCTLSSDVVSLTPRHEAPMVVEPCFIIDIQPATSCVCALDEFGDASTTCEGDDAFFERRPFSPGMDDVASCASIQLESVNGDATNKDTDEMLLAMPQREPPECEQRSRPTSARDRWRIFVEQQIFCDTNEQMVLWEAQQALANIVNKPLQMAISDLQRQLLQAFKGNDKVVVATLIQNLKNIVAPESQRLEGLTVKCMEKYRIGKARWKFVESIFSYDDGMPQKVLSELGDMPMGDKLAVLLAEAEWRRPSFEDMVLNIVAHINGASDVADICRNYGLDQKDFYLPLQSANPYDFGGTVSPGTLAKVHFGPPKLSERAEAKGLEWLVDLDRATIEFEDPYVLAVAYRMLSAHSKNTITVVQNKYLQERFTQPPNLHLIIEMDGWKVELQLILSDFLKIKQEQHKLYEIIRAKDAKSLLKPIYELDSPDQ